MRVTLPIARRGVLAGLLMMWSRGISEFGAVMMDRLGGNYPLHPDIIQGMSHGLTLGKFAPFHRGHQFLIETALAEMDQVSVIIYDCPETTSVPLTVRADWIRVLYPQVNLITAWDGPTEVGDSPGIKQQHEDYILNRLRIRKIKDLLEWMQVLRQEQRVAQSLA